MRRLFWSMLLVALTGAMPVLAVQPDEVLADQRLETRARDLSRELRCMVCQNQSIDDSDAPLARDLRILVRERLQAGDSDQQVLDFLTARYGEFVLLKPQFNLHTGLLWLLPATLVMVGIFSLIVLVRRQRRSATTDEKLTPTEKARLGALVKSQNE
jgi:cytochrome c-type biogenesis protein CcmH